MTFMLKVCNRASFFLNCFFNFLGFLYIFYFLIGVQLFYNVVLVFAVQQCESAMVGWWFYSLSHVWLLWPHGLQPARLLCPRDSLGKNTGVVCHFLLQGIFLIQGSNLIGESAICICISPPSWASLPPHPRLTSLGHHWASSWSPCAIQQLPTSIILHICVYTLMLLSQFIPYSPSPPVSASPFSDEESCVQSKDFTQGSFW